MRCNAHLIWLKVPLSYLAVVHHVNGSCAVCCVVDELAVADVRLQAHIQAHKHTKQEAGPSVVMSQWQLQSFLGRLGCGLASR